MKKIYWLFLFWLIFVINCFASETITLDQAIKEAIQHHPGIKAVKRQIEALGFSRKKEAAKRWLNVDFYATAERHSSPITVVPISAPGKFPEFSRDIYSWEIKASIPIYDGGRVSRLVKIKDLELLSEKDFLKSSVEDLIANVKQLYFAVLYLKTLKKANEKLLEILKKEEQLADLKYKAGKVAQLDLLYFERARLQEEASLEEVKKKLEATKEILSLLMGREKCDFVVQGDIFKLPLEKIPQNKVLTSLIEDRSDVKMAQVKVSQSEAAVELAKREFWPKLSLFSSYGYRAGAGLNYRKEVWTIGIQLSIPIFDSGVREYQVMENQRKLLAAIDQLKATKLKAKEEIINALAEIKAYKTQIRKYKASVRFAKEVFEKESVRYRTGAGNIVDLLSAQEAWLKAKMALIKAYFDLHTAMVKLELNTGQIAKGYYKDEEI